MIQTNLYELYKQEITGCESVLDIGCGKFRYLVCFEDGPFEILHGIDKKIDNGYYQTYYHSRYEINIKPLGLEDFSRRYRVNEVDIRTFDLGANLHNFIICRNLLHFFPYEDMFPLIKRMYAALLPNGLLYIQLHHTENPNITDPKLSNRLDTNIYASKTNPDDIFYLSDSSLFIEEVKINYNILNNDVKKNERGFMFVIKKE